MDTQEIEEMREMMKNLRSALDETTAIIGGQIWGGDKGETINHVYSNATSVIEDYDDWRIRCNV